VKRLAALALLWLVMCPRTAPSQTTGVITTIAGATPVGGPPVRGFGGDRGPATAALLALANQRNECDPAQFEQVSHLAVAANGSVYFTDSNNQRVRQIAPDGIITTIAGSGQRPDINTRCEPAGPIGDGSQAAAARLYNSSDVVFDPNGGLIIVDQQNNRIRQVAPSGQISTIVGSGQHAFYAPGVPALTSGMDWPSSAALDASGVLHFAELHSNRVARIAADGRIVTVAGDGFPGFSGDNGPAVRARLSNPTGIAFDGAGNLYIADQANHRVRRVTPAGTISTFAGTGQAGFSGDGGQAQSAALNQPTDVAADARGNIYVADMGNHRVRRISAAGVILTVAGTGQAGRGADGVAATASSLNFPSSVAVDAAGDLYILDWQNFLIRKVSYSSRPTVSPGGVVNGASFAPAPIPVAPGSIVAIFGVNLAPSTASATDVPLPTQLAGTSVRVNGMPIPLFFVSPGQINAQLPGDAAPGTARLAVTSSGGESTQETFNVASSAVGIFQFPGSNRAVALNQDGSVNGADNPEARGRVIVVFLTGQGPVNPPVATGEAASGTQLSRAVLAASATVGRLPANLSFLGLTPGFVGLAQANVEIPANAPQGSEVVIFLTVDGRAGNTATVSIR